MYQDERSTFTKGGAKYLTSIISKLITFQMLRNHSKQELVTGRFQ